MADNYDMKPDLYTLVDEEGVEQAFELLDAMEENDERYYALVPYYENPEDIATDDGELVILKAQLDGDEEILVSIDNDEEFERIGQIFLQRIDAMFDEECDCDDCGCGSHHCS